MSPSLIALVVLQLAAAALLIVLAVQGFRTHPVWGFLPLLVLLGPLATAGLHLPGAVGAGVALWGLIGTVVFALKHQQKAGVIFLLYLGCLGGTIALFVTSPSVVAFYARYNPRMASLVKTVNPSVYEEAQKLSPSGDKAPGAKPTPHEVRDLAENETPFPSPPSDPNAVPRAAYLKHAKELNTLYQQLNAERPKLKSGSPAVAAFNAKAARYQQGIQTLAEEKTKLDALDHASNLNADAALALASLQTSAGSGDYETFAATLKKSLSDYRQTPSFPQIVACARPALQQATPDKVLAGLQNKAASTARGEFDKTTRKVQAIVNQVPPIVVPPPGSTEVYKYGYHPGANPPDYNADNLLATRETWKGEYSYIDSVPNVFYRSSDCEFNPQTKYFYLSRTVAKKKLSDVEYAELTRLYHLLGQQEKAISEVKSPASDAERVSNDLATLKAQLDGYAAK